MAQVVSNLVENAIKYAPQGQITVRARASREGARVEVQDEGPGIPPEEQPRVWEKFYRGAQVAGRNCHPGERDRAGRGAGPGGGPGGRRRAAQRPGQGSTFWLEVPQAQAPLEEAEEPEPDEGAQPTAQPAAQPMPRRPRRGAAPADLVAPGQARIRAAPWPSSRSRRCSTGSIWARSCGLA